MKKIRVLLALLLMCALLPTLGLAEAPYFTLTENHEGWPVYSPSGYLPDATYTTFADEALKRPADLFVYDDDTVFIADEGNKRVIHMDENGEVIRIWEGKELKSPGGLYARAGKLYVADVKQEQVYVYDIATGKQLTSIVHPENALYGLKSAFKPLKVAVDEAGCVYVISKGNTNGIAQFSQDGTFLGYFGANTTELSLGEKLKRLTYTQEQLAMLKRNVPSTPTSLDMDARGLVYTVTTGQPGVRRLNMAGQNILKNNTAWFDNPVDVAVGKEETMFTVNESGYIVEQTRDGRTLFYFGGEDSDRTRTGLFVAAVAIDVDSKGRLYVLDRDKTLVQRFEITDYARLVHSALVMYQEGLYADSREPWEEVLSLNSMFDYAHMGLGRAYYKLGRYDEALSASRQGGDKEAYSDSFWEVRNVWLQNNILYLAAGIVALVLLRKLWKTLRRRWKPAMALANGLHRLGETKLMRELRFMGYFPRNPADAFYGVRFEGKVSVLSSTILYGVLFVVYMLGKYACGFLFKTIEDGRYEVGTDLVLVLGGLGLFLIACNLICSIRDGEGTFKQMYCGLAYAMGPYIMLKPLSIILSYVLTTNEAFIITCIDLVAIVGCLVLIVMMVKTLQNYTFKETFATLLLTLFTMLMLVIAGVIAVALVAQLWEFITAVWKEASFYYER